MATFENTLNGYRESTGWGNVAGAALLGALYFVFKGLWRHVLGYLLLVPLSSFLLMGWMALLHPALGLVGLLTPHLIYAGFTPELLRAKYLRAGWREVPD